jgi:hypothetical protein
MNNNNRKIEQVGTYEEIVPLIVLCKAGRLFEVQEWISAGMPVNPPPPAEKKARKKSPLQVAIEAGFHSLVQLLLQGGAAIEEPRYSPLAHALEKHRLDLVELLVNHGADIHSVTMEEVLGTWNNDIVEFFIAKGADMETGNPLGLALCLRIRTALAIFKRYQDRFPSFQEQVNIALRHHCKEGNLKWVSLMLWAGGDPHLKGPDSPHDSDPDDYNSALELAAIYEHFDIFKLKAIRLDSKHPGAGELLRNACYNKKPLLLKMLLEKKFSPRDLEDRGSSLIQSLLSRMSWNLDFWTRSKRENDIDSYESREIIKMIHMLVRHGARWEPIEKGEVSLARRSLMKMKSDYIMEFIWIMSEYKACPRNAIDDLIKNPVTRSMVSEHIARLNMLMDSFADSQAESHKTS